MGKAAQPGTKHKIGALTDQMRAFAMHYTTDFNGKAAAIRAGYAETSATVQASKLLAREDVQELIRKRMETLERKTGLDGQKVLEQAWGIVTADVNELVEFRRRCCRHCYGIDHGYQRTIQEMSQARRQYELDRRKAEKAADFDPLMYEEFDEQGGVGYDARLAPNPDCTKCWGDGEGDAFFKPTANLTPAARALYAGVKQTKDGYQMLLVDKNASMERLFKHFGLYEKDNKQQANGITALLEAITARGGRLPIGHKQ